MDRWHTFWLKNKRIIVVFLLAFFLRILISPLVTLELDFNTFRAWSARLVDVGFGNFYDTWSDYLPGYLYVLWALSEIHKFLPIPEVLLFKLPAILSDLATGFIIFRVVSRIVPLSLALLFSSFYLFNPAVIANSTLWGQIDGITTLSIITSLFFVNRLPLVSVVSLCIGALIKPQAAFVAPLVFILWFRNYGLSKTFFYTFLCFMLYVLCFLPFTNGKELIPFVSERLTVTANQYPYTSVNAFNFWAILGMWKSDLGIPQIVGIALTILFSFFILYKTFHLNEKLKIINYLAACSLLLIAFIFPTRMHERHMLPVLAPLLVAATEYPVLWVSYILLSLTYVLNLQYSFIWITENFREIFSKELIFVFSFINLVALWLMVTVFFKPEIGIKFFSQFKIKNLYPKSFPQLKIPTTRIPFIEKHKSILLMSILSFALLSRVVGLWFPADFYFDEVYHAFTAREILRGNASAWEWLATPPKGFAYEWTHPPFAKLGMVGGMFLFGQTPFGWRLPGALLGTASVFLIYLVGFHLFKNKTIGLFSAAIFALDGVPLVMSRIGMNDSYFLFFAILSLFLFLKKRYFLSSVALGLAGASKWTTLWVFVLIFLAILIFRQKPRFRMFYFLVIPPLVYLACYIPFFATGHTVSQFIELQRQMWWYHTGLRATHAYQSSALTWPLDLRPVWLFTDSKDNFSANIYILGNPIVFWLGLFSVGMMGIVGVVRRSAPLIFILVAWGLMFLPWAASPRVMFLYHYLPAIPFLSIATGWFLSRQRPKFILLFLLVSFLIYFFFLPHWLGIFVPRWLDNLYYTVPSWK